MDHRRSQLRFCQETNVEPLPVDPIIVKRENITISRWPFYPLALNPSERQLARLKLKKHTHTKNTYANDKFMEGNYRHESSVLSAIIVTSQI